MTVDRYTKTVLTIIAIALIGINVALWDPSVKPAYAQTSVYVTNADEIGKAVYRWCDMC